MLIPMYRFPRTRTVLSTAAFLLLLVGVVRAGQEHTLHVAVADVEGNPVPGLTEDDMIVQWDGENLETTNFEAVDWPVRLTVLIDNSDNATTLVPQVRDGLRALLRELPAEMEIAMLTTAREPRWVTRHTTNRAELDGNIANIAPDTGATPTFIDTLVGNIANIARDTGTTSTAIDALVRNIASIARDAGATGATPTAIDALVGNIANIARDTGTIDALVGNIANIARDTGATPTAIDTLVGNIANIARDTGTTPTVIDTLVRDIANVARDTGTAATFNDALVEETNRIHDDDDREYYPVILTIATDGPDRSRSQQGQLDRMVERMVENSVEVHTLLYVGHGLGARSVAAGVGEALAPLTRGTFERFTVPTAVVERLEALGRDIARKHGFVSNQYRITYRQPRNPSSQPRIGVATERAGLQMLPTLDGNVPSRMPRP